MIQRRLWPLANIPAPGPPFHIVTGRVGTACQPSCLYSRAPPAGRGAIYLALLTKKGAAKPRPYLSSVIRTLYSYFNTFPPLHRSSAPICTLHCYLSVLLFGLPYTRYSSQPSPSVVFSVIRTLYSVISRPPAALTFPPLHRSSAPICTFALSPFTSPDSSLDSFLDSVLYSSRVQTAPPRLRFDPLGPGRDR